MNPSKITCPKCSTVISIDEVLGHQIQESLKKEFEKKREEERADERKKMLEWKEKLESEAKLKAENQIKDLRLKIKEEEALETKVLKEELEKQKQEAQKAKDQELQLRKKTNELEEREKNFELEKMRQLDEEREKIRQATAEQMFKEHQLKDAEKTKQMEDMRRKIEELQQKANLTSQQLQGEVLELELEEFLKKEFPMDEIIPVAKGVRGADVLQKVRDQFGRECGTIIWESKRSKTWTEGWISKLKDDMRNSKGDVAILVSSVLPAGVKFFGPRDGVFLTAFECILGVSSQIRLAIIRENQIKGSVVGKNEKMEVLWEYLSSNQFSQKMESIIEAFSVMKEDLEKEKKQFVLGWAKREKQIERIINSTLGMHGDLQGLMGASLPEIKSLEMDNFELVETTEIKITEDNAIQTTISEVSFEKAIS